MYVELKNINKVFKDYKASDNINFGIEKGNLAALLGPSGSGKTTILRMIAGLETPDSGEIIVDGKKVNNIPPGERGIGFVFQNYALFRYMTVFDNIAFGLRVRKDKKEDIKKRVSELIDLIGLTGLDRRYPSQLSGGQRQRVAFARALAPNPHLLLLDEPFAAVDAKVRIELRGWLRDIIDRLSITSIFVTHDQEEAIEVADEIIVTNQGRVEQIGSPIEIYKHPDTAFAAQFIGQSTVIHDVTRFQSFRSWGKGKSAVIRPEFINIIKKNEIQKYASSAEEGIVEHVAFRGNNIEVKVRIHNELLTASRLIDEAPISIGEKVDVFIYRLYIIDGDKAYLLENESLREDSLVL